jgi:ferredoxin
MRLHIKFSHRIVRNPIISQVVLATKAPINILRARIDHNGGEMLLEVPDEFCKEVKKEFERYGVEVQEVKSVVEHNTDLCVDCGLCVSICPTSAFSFDTDFKLKLHEDRCVQCGLCVTSCPHGALSLVTI